MVLEVRADGIYVRDAYTDQNGGTNTKAEIANFSLDSVVVAATGVNFGEYFLMGNVYAVNELPELPEGIVCGYKGE